MTNQMNLTEEELRSKYNELGSLRLLARYLHISDYRAATYLKKYHIKHKGRKYTVIETFFANDTPESFYLAGFIAADGNIYDNKKHHCLSISLKEEDQLHLEKIKNIIGSNHKLYKRTIKNSKRNIKYKDTITYSLSLWAPQLIEDLKRFNIGHRKSLTYDMPEWLQKHNLISHFLRGYFDGDGSITLDKLMKLHKTRQARIHIRGTKEFLTNFHSILYDQCGLKTRYKKISNDSGIGSLQYTGNNNVCKIMEYLYADAAIYLDRKFAKYQEIVTNSK
jgi:intein/homing endonuclease